MFPKRLALCAAVCDGLLLPRSFHSSDHNPVPEAVVFSPHNESQKCRDQVYWNLCNGSQATEYTNTLKRGYGAKGGEFRVREIAVVEGVTLDLVLTVPEDEKYALMKPPGRGKKGNFMHVSPEPLHPFGKLYEKGPGPPCWIVIPWKTETNTKFNWKFVHTGTNTVANNLVSFTLGIVELDQERADDQEYVTFDTPYTTLLHQGTSVSAPTAPTFGMATFRSVELGVTTDNPSLSGPLKDGCSPTEQEPYGCIVSKQQGRTIHVEYENIAEWQLTLGHESVHGSQGDRFLEFYGTTCRDPPPPCAPTKYWNLCSTWDSTAAVHAAYNNSLSRGLGKEGSEFRVTNISTVDGTEIDLVLTIPSTETYSLKNNGNNQNNFAHVSPIGNLNPLADEPLKSPCWMVIPWKVESATRWNWKFVVSGTNTPKELVAFTLGIVELDQQMADDHEYVKFDTAYSELISKGDLVTQSIDADGRDRFDSQDLGVTEDNPSISGPDPDGVDCTPTIDDPYRCIGDKQSKRSVRVKYENRAEFDLTIGHWSETGRQGDRFLEFYGTTCES